MWLWNLVPGNVLSVDAGIHLQSLSIDQWITKFETSLFKLKLSQNNL